MFCNKLVFPDQTVFPPLPPVSRGPSPFVPVFDVIPPGSSGSHSQSRLFRAAGTISFPSLHPFPPLCEVHGRSGPPRVRKNGSCVRRRRRFFLLKTISPYLLSLFDLRGFLPPPFLGHRSRRPPMKCHSDHSLFLKKIYDVTITPFFSSQTTPSFSRSQFPPWRAV